MRNKLFLLILLLGSLFIGVNRAQANDYLEKEKHYRIYAAGVNKVHFVIPVWAYGKGYDYYAYDDSYVSYTVNGGSETRIAWYKTDKYDENENKNSKKGTAYIKLLPGQGDIIVTSMANGVNYQVPSGSWTGKMYVTQKEDDDCPQVTMLEFDWFIPASLEKSTFSVKIVSKFRRSYTDGNAMTTTVSETGIKGTTTTITPQLYTPYLYTLNEKGVAGYGYAAVPYMVFQEPKKYYTSFEPSVIHDKDIERSGTIYVPTTDTIQEQLRVTFTVVRTSETGNDIEVKSTAQDIPPYHRIYDFAVKEEKDKTGTFTGRNLLTWNIKNPMLKDLLGNDYFEIQRALKSDFSDATRVEIVQMRRDTLGLYTLYDGNRSTWTGNADVINNSVKESHLKTRQSKYCINDPNLGPIAEIDATLHANEINIPGVPVYYRIRRASASMWEWDNEFTRTATLYNKNFLAPLATTQEQYTKDADYEQNYKVHFRFKIENKDAVAPNFIDKSKCDLTYSINQVLYEFEPTVTITYDGGNQYTTMFNVYDKNGYITEYHKRFAPGTYTFPMNSKLLIFSSDTGIDESYELKLTSTSYSIVIRPFRRVGSAVDIKDTGTTINSLIESHKKSIIDSLYNVMIRENTFASYGKSMWDRSAQLVLQRTIEETGRTMEFIIPQDSIKRQEDGSWIATYSDVADQGCSHYKYAVRIDQSKCDLHVQDSASLQPIPLTGPSLYFDEAATITRFEATQGDATTRMKPGVLLRWESSSNAVDEFVLLRKEVGSDATPDTVYHGMSYDYFDRSAKPDQHYEYTIVASYTCNDKTTANNRSAIGWRTPYGEISGTIKMPDNSGMAGVEVALQKGGEVIERIVTNGTGAFKFDSLLYDKVLGTDYSIIPMHSYGKFSFNNTNAGTASITLTPDNAVESDLDFVNTSAVRMTGRVLYKQSTIPVAGAMFLLNGDTVRRGDDPLTSGIDGNFELLITKGQACKLQVFKQGHVFEGDGILHKEQKKDSFALDEALDGVRFYDMTKVRLVGRVAGGNDQRDLAHGFALGKNNLGDKLQLVLQLEGDNTAHFVHDPNDLTLDTVKVTTDHIIYNTDPLTTEHERKVGTTHALFEKKRIIITPDNETGEYAVDLFPVKYKVVQATATGYASLFANGQGAETFDLTNAPLQAYVTKYDAEALQLTETFTQANSQPVARTYSLLRDNPLRAGDSICYGAIYDRIYHSPVEVSLTQVLYGIEKDGYGEEEMEVSSMNITNKQKVKLYTKQPNASIEYLLRHPVFMANRKYQFIARAYERYYYNNTPGGTLDEVPQRGGSVRVHNGLKSATTYQDYNLDEKGENHTVSLDVRDIDTENSGNDALRTVSTALEVEGNWVETDVFQAFVSGTDIQPGELMQTPSAVVLLDVVRDPGGSTSSAWVESGSTYNFSYTESYDWEIGVELTPQFGVSITQDIGAVAAPNGGGSYIGSTYENQRQLSFTQPITHEWKWGYKYNYQFSTSERITTSTSKAKTGVGSNADIFIGTTMSQLAGKAKTVSIISDSMFIARKPAIEAGMMKVLGSGYDADGKRYHLVTGQQIVLGTTIGNSFVYTQTYVLNTLIPKLALERKNLLMDFPDSISAQRYADNNGIVVYWNKGASAAANTEDMNSGEYLMLKPAGKDNLETDRIAALNNMIRDWVKIVYFNEKEKVMARLGGKPVGTWSISAGTTVSHTDNYTATLAYSELPQSASLFGFEMANNSSKAAQKLLADMPGIIGFFKGMGKDQIGTSVAEALNGIATQNNGGQGPGVNTGDKAQQQTLGTKTNSSKFSLKYNPVFSFDSDNNATTEKTIKKSSGFTLGADSQGDLTVSVYRAEIDSIWEKRTDTIRSRMENAPQDEGYLYGSYVFFTQAGSTYCPHEDEEKTQFYNKGTIINNETQWIHKPELSVDTHEQTAVMPDKRATFRITMMDAGQMQTGPAADAGTGFDLLLVGSSNPDGAKLYMDGAPVITSVPVWLSSGQAVTKVLEVERGLVDDYENLTLMLTVSDCPKTNTSLKLSVHFLPVASDVSITMPRQNWIMNTLSPHDSAGYYLPVEIDGFDIHHKNFDHIEFQYKLSTESEEKWVNQCSFFASDSLYALATGNKAMIENGRIPQFRFYGERDPMEQQYDLRAVCFCRYGSGFVTKASPVIRGTKDTRPPRVFGNPEPANAILGVGDHLLLRFNEPIAGNYLDEDNNFQLLGITNHTGISASTAIQFSGTADSYASSSVERSLTDKSFTVEMMVKPTSPNADEVFFTHGDKGKGLIFGKTADNRLYAQIGDLTTYYSKKLADPMLAFTRVAVTYSKENGFRFYVGTVDMTEPSALSSKNIEYSLSAPLIFGQGYAGQMLEARVWTKALTLEEIAATFDHYLTGYEQELLAYYRMSEGKGENVKDHAHGATLSLHGCIWNKLQGFSVQLAKEQRVKLKGNLFGRSKVYDATHMFWFRTTDNAAERANLFSAGRTDDKHGALIALENGNIVLCSDSLTWIGSVNYADGEWHHVVLSINRTYNNAALFVDGSLIQTFPATVAAGAQGDMYLGGNFAGNIDEFAVFEQALPKSLVEAYDNIALVGDEMGLIAYLPFEEQFLNPNGVLEQRFSINDRRQFKDAYGKVIDKVLPLVDGDITALADNTQNAPVTSHGALTKLNFDWSFNGDELMINLNMLDKEINKQSIYITVRDVEDLNGNPMRSPVTWTAFVDHNSLKWAEKQISYWDTETPSTYELYTYTRIINTSGKRHTYKIESLPDWLTVNQAYGTIEPQDEVNVKLSYKETLPVGAYNDIIYVVDEDGLAEPLQLEYFKNALPPYDGVDGTKYPLNMSICGQVKINDVYDSDEKDIVFALYRNECIGKANVAYDNTANTSNIYITIFGNEAMTGKTVNFILWQASTGRTYNLICDRDVRFLSGSVYGCGTHDPVLFSTGGSEMQNINLDAGWNWISFNLKLDTTTGVIRNVMTANEPWKEGDLIKNPSSQQFVTYSETMDAFLGTIKAFDYRDMYMLYAAGANAMHISGDPLPEDKMEITIKGNGEWSPMPCLLQQATTITEAFAGYYDQATPGDIVKSHNRFAVFSLDRKWVGDLKAIRPGEGYLFCRMGAGDVTVKFYNKPANAPQRAPKFNGNAATNMTMICQVEGLNELTNEGVKAFVGDELVGVATKIDSLYFLTVSSDFAGELRFETEDGTPLSSEMPINYVIDSHHGTLKAPIILSPGDDRPYKILENNHVIIIRNNEKYDITGKKL